MNAKDLLIPSQRHMLGTLRGLLDKAAADPRGLELLNARIVEDMHPLATQIRFLCNMAGEAMERVAGIEFTSNEENPASYAQAYSLIDATLADLAEWSKLDFKDDQSPVELTLGNGMTFDLTLIEYVRDWNLPQFYFHTTAAYAILRKEGLDVGKADYVPHMFAYLRRPAS